MDALASAIQELYVHLPKIVLTELSQNPKILRFLRVLFVS
jgi:hypothetical protein